MDSAVDAIMSVMDAAFDPLHGEAWTRRQVADALVLGNCHYLIVGPDGGPWGKSDEPAGFAMTRRAADEEELLLLAVKPEFQRRGIGSAIIKQLSISSVQNGIAKMFLEMREGNPALSLYIAKGFVQVGRRRDYYRRGDGGLADALTFVRTL